MLFNFSFLYDVTRFPNYELTYLWFAYTTFVSVTAALAIDSLFYAFALNLSAHFRIVQHRMHGRRNFQNRDGQLSSTFRRVIRYHRNVIELCTCLAYVYWPVVFTQLMITSMQLCVIAYQITLVSAFCMVRCVFFLIYRFR